MDNWWQQLADMYGQTLYVLTTQKKVDGSTETCIAYCVNETSATPWERDPANYVAKYVPKGD